MSPKLAATLDELSDTRTETDPFGPASHSAE
jgi:hypothetical protein